MLETLQHLPLADNCNIMNQPNGIADNHHIHDFSESVDPINKRGVPLPEPQQASVCMGCKQTIFDRYILRVSPNLEWHAACLRCHQCHMHLDEHNTAFVRDGKTYCKDDYARLFPQKCARCNKTFHHNDTVNRAKHRVYHVECFRCTLCNVPLEPGQHFGLLNDQLRCREHHDMVMQQANGGIMNTADLIRTSVDGSEGAPMDDPFHSTTVTPPCTMNGTPMNMVRPIMPPMPLPAHPMLPLINPPPPPHGPPPPSSHGHGHGKSHRKSKEKSKTTRIRTVLNEKQLNTLRHCYNQNSRPDALMKENLVEMTGLSPRVIRVWFQNKRCKDKKKTMAYKHMQQQNEKNHALQCVRSSGLGPLAAGSPGMHDGPAINQQPLDIHGLQQMSRPGGGATWQPLPPGQLVMMNGDGSVDGEGGNPFQQLMHGFGGSDTAYNLDGSMDMDNMDDTEVDLDSFSPHMMNSDLSSPEGSD